MAEIPVELTPSVGRTNTSRLSQLTREFLLLFVPVAVLVIAGAWALAESRIKTEVATILAEEKAYVDLGAGRLVQELAIPVRHLHSLINEAPVRAAYQAENGQYLAQIEQSFTSLLSRNPRYDQVRWIDEAGMERVRVNNREGRPSVVPEEQLQNKRQRYYFSETMALPPGVVYISPLDLSVENGEIERPYKATIRVAGKVFDQHGGARGILIINVSADSMLETFVASSGPAGDRVMLLNGDGYWLKSPVQSDEWGFMLGQDLRLGTKNPRLWQQILDKPSGNLRLPDGYWTWKRVVPAFDKDTSVSHKIRWTVLCRFPDEALRQLAWSIWPAKLFGAFIVLLLFALGIARLVQSQAGKMQAEKEAALVRNEIEATRRLQDAQASFEMLFQANTNALLVVDETGRIVMVNPAFESMFGYAVSEVQGRGVEMLLPDDMRAQHAAHRRVFMSAPTSRAMGAGRDLYGTRKDGSVFPIEIGLSPYRDTRKLFVLATIADISERKRAQDTILQMNEWLEKRVTERTEELQAARLEAERLASVKGNFLANMSHEIRTPLNAVLGLAYLLERTQLDANQLELIQKIRVAGRSLLGIINDILDFSKIESGHLEIEHAPFRLNDVLDNVATLMSAVEHKTDVELSMGPAPQGMEFLRGDALRLEQILVNLVTNALKFTDQGSVLITASRLPRHQGSERIRFSVKDTGKGITLDKQAEIFNAFSQEDSSTSRRFGGTGLGLTICRRLVEKMGGKIGVVSEPGKGSDFWFELPVELVESQDFVHPSMAFQGVLIADDHPVARDMLAATVRSIGWNPEVVCSGEEAVERFFQKAQLNKLPDIVLLDWYMPGMSGLEAGISIKKSLGDAAAPIILIATAYDRENLLRQAGIELADGVLSKPITASNLYNAVSEAKRKRLGQHGVHAVYAEPDKQRLAGLRILVVDDSEINRDMARRILEAEGGSVQVADDGPVALEWLNLNTQGVDVVLMDIQMPLMDGYETTRQIRDVLGLKSLPIIALTAGAFKNQQVAALAAGLNGFVAKPFDVDELVTLLQHYIPDIPATTLPVQPGKAEEADMVIDMARGLHSWGDEATYYKYLRKFADAHGRDGYEIGELLTAKRIAEANALVHKLKGTASNLAVMTVWRLAEQLEQALAAGLPAQALSGKLQAELDAALQAIARIAPPLPIDATTVAEVNDAEASLRLLQELLQALDSDNPDQAEPLLQALAAHLPYRALKPLFDMLDGFDFRAAERETRRLIEQLVNQ